MKSTLIAFLFSISSLWTAVHAFVLPTPTGIIGTGAVRSVDVYDVRTYTYAYTSTASSQSPTTLRLTSSADNTDDDNGSDTDSSSMIDITQDPRLYRIRIPRFPGIEWGTDLSFSFVYVRDMDPAGPASLSGLISKGDQICELRPVPAEDGEKSEVVPLLGASFDAVMGAFANLKRNTKDVDLVFFRGTKEELIALCNGDGQSDTSGNDGREDGKIKITVVQNKGSSNEEIKIIYVDEGANVRQTLVDEGINVYQSVTRWTNCKGKQLCGTCIVNVAEGSGSTNRKSMDEASTLRENPDSYRLSCVTFAYGDVTVETFPPIKAAQWTR